MSFETHSIQLLGVDGALPTEFRLFKLGVNETTKGAYTLDEAGSADVIADRAKRGIKLAVDYEHQTYLSATNGQPAPAAGWVQVEARGDGLWATNARWTPRASKMFRDGEYQYFSPTFKHDANRRIVRLMVPALTNDPASHDISELVAASDAAPAFESAKPPASLAAVPSSKEIQAMPNIAAIIGLKDDAPEGEIEGRAVSLAGLERDLLNATGVDNIGAAMAAVVSLKSIAAENETLRKAVADHEALRAQDEASERRKTFDAVMLGCFETGKVSRKDEDQVSRMTNLFEKHGIEALNACVAGLRGRPAPVYQAAMPTNLEEQKLRAYNAAKAANPGMDPVAVAMLSQQNAGGR